MTKDDLSINLNDSDLEGRRQVWVRIDGLSFYVVFYRNNMGVTFWKNEEKFPEKVKKRVLNWKPKKRSFHKELDSITLYSWP